VTISLSSLGYGGMLYDSSTLDRYWNGSALLGLPGLRVEGGYER
jgi:hypothetical protein